MAKNSKYGAEMKLGRIVLLSFPDASPKFFQNSKASQQRHRERGVSKLEVWIISRFLWVNIYDKIKEDSGYSIGNTKMCRLYPKMCPKVLYLVRNFH